VAIELPAGPSGARRRLRRGGYGTRALDRLTVTVLRRHHATTAIGGHGGGFVFTTTRSNPIKPDRLGELFHRLVRDADLPPIRLMTCATARLACPWPLATT
jgi:hypothetical protein